MQFILLREWCTFFFDTCIPGSFFLRCCLSMYSFSVKICSSFWFAMHVSKARIYLHGETLIWSLWHHGSASGEARLRTHPWCGASRGSNTGDAFSVQVSRASLLLELEALQWWQNHKNTFSMWINFSILSVPCCSSSSRPTFGEMHRNQLMNGSYALEVLCTHLLKGFYFTRRISGISRLFLLSEAWWCLDSLFDDAKPYSHHTTIVGI